jgi:twitching motility protein PilT
MSVSVCACDLPQCRFALPRLLGQGSPEKADPGVRAIDSVLRILVQRGGTELRLASDRRPQMFQDDDELPLTIPAMSAARIRELLGDMWTSHEDALQRHGQVSLTYGSPELGDFALMIVGREESTLEVSFRRDRSEGVPELGASPPAVLLTAVTTADSLPAGLAAMVTRAASLGASDLHLSPQRPPIVRINGVLQAFEPVAAFDPAGLLDGGQLERLRNEGSVDRAFDVPGAGRVRANVYRTEDGLCAALRILKRDAPSHSDLNLPPQLEALVDLSHGLVIACGPTGCGKSSTLAALAQHALRKQPRVLVTLEDPIEYIIKPMSPSGLVRQREVGTHVPDFATGLRGALREDPDVLLIGEMRDIETITLALTAAETGHLVFASLHSRTAPSAIERMVDIYPPERQRQIRVQIADSVRAVISQRLVPTADGTSRVPAVELLRVTHAVANLIREGRTAQIVSALQAGANEGMLVMERSLADLVRSRRIRRDTAFAAANDPTTLEEYLRAAGC